MRLPIPVAPARHETVASYLTRLAALHGLHLGELVDSVGSPRPGTRQRIVHADRLAAVTGHPVQHLQAALPELRDPGPDWAAWRHQPQPRCPRCDARHDGGVVQRLLPHHRYVCTRHRYWIGPPDAGQTATPLSSGLDDIVRAQWRHHRLVRRHGAAAAFDAVLTGFLICGHLWDDNLDAWIAVRLRWERRSDQLIPLGSEMRTFSASRVFAAAYPEAVAVGELLAAPAWRARAGGDAGQQRQLYDAIGRRLGRSYYRPPESGDVIAHWMIYDSRQPPSRPTKTFPDTREHGSIRPAQVSPRSRDRHDRSAMWFSINRRGGSVLLHHRHVRPVLVRDWSTPMDGVEATIWASQHVRPVDRPHPSNPSARPLILSLQEAARADTGAMNADPTTINLWRPTGPEELALVEASGWRAWPPRLPEQPIFYPVLNRDYAVRIASDWNVKHSGAGYVAEFRVRKDFLDRYPVQQAGGRTILEYWIPAEDLEEFNRNIVGLIEVVDEFHV